MGGGSTERESLVNPKRQGIRAWGGGWGGLTALALPCLHTANPLDLWLSFHSPVEAMTDWICLSLFVPSTDPLMTERCKNLVVQRIDCRTAVTLILVVRRKSVAACLRPTVREVRP